MISVRFLRYCCSSSVKAIEAAINARQWNKAVQIVELQDDSVAQKLVNVPVSQNAFFLQF